jgi:hypothetical protein
MDRDRFPQRHGRAGIRFTVADIARSRWLIMFQGGNGSGFGSSLFGARDAFETIRAGAFPRRKARNRSNKRYLCTLIGFGI